MVNNRYSFLDEVMVKHHHHQMTDDYHDTFPEDECVGTAVDFVPNPLYYHQMVAVDFIKLEDDMIYLEIGEVPFAVPSRLCREVDLKSNALWIHSKSWESIKKSYTNSFELSKNR